MLKSPKLKRNITRIIPFGIIWLVTGWVFLLSEAILTGNQNLNPDSSVSLSIPVFIFASVTSLIVGLLVGLIELVILEKRFRYYSFARKVSIKFLVYMAVMLTVMAIGFPLATSIEQSIPVTSPLVFERTISFFQSLTFLLTVIQVSFQLAISLLYAAISENLGPQVLRNFFTGKYHSPIKELRIFMFLDMKSSTVIAEEMGHDQYFDLLRDYYEIMSDPIIKTYGEVYQYIGDEVVVTWTADKGLSNDNCLACFKLIKEALRGNASFFDEKYHQIPDFKAAIHIGEVTTGEIGALKKEVVYTGDVMNTTARVQSLCSEYQADLIITDDLLTKLKDPERWTFRSIGELALKGKSRQVKLHIVENI